MIKAYKIKRATIKDVARAAGVSIATVSRVINGNYYVSPRIEEKVQQAIAESGYVPNSVARSLKSNTTYLIGFIVSDISNFMLMSIARSIENVIRDNGYNLLVCSTENDEELERKYIDALVSRNISGIVLHSTGKLEEYITQVSQHVPIALVYRHVEHSGFIGDTIDTDARQASYDMTRHLIDSGHKRIGMLNGYMQFSTSRDRWRGFCSAMEEAGLPVNDKYIANGDFTEADGYTGTLRMMSQDPPPTALIGMNTAVTVGAMKYLQEAGISIPEDISVVCYGEVENSELMKISPTRVPQFPSDLGSKVGELILDRIKNPGRSNREVIFGAKIIPGNSVAPPPNN
ncbi:hypothetical protein B4O97_01945 [Marispirochaeta aestuarii]|uniref:HTH lacI-type domain-containing protein n=1 Tax=Marispirochaeta aestuarii TaxID=1963862 RepID=A0A1Y1S1W6_9SPIO|nr:LacI family DNA-binding transcriptional regulator [Marispirochaeta aestuarii]ORC37788.1 hypothetical protein B4O97_01945 [Marispirochaeta aestuarii]